MIYANLVKSALLSLPLAVFASCTGAPAGDSASQSVSAPAPTSTPTPTPGSTTAVARGSIKTATIATYDEPWALAFAPGTSVIFVTQQSGKMNFVDTATGRLGTVSGLPRVDYGGQGGLGDVAFLESEASGTLERRAIYLSWVEAGNGDTRGAVVGRGTLVCQEADSCKIEGMKIIWRQVPKVEGRGHYSHRIAFSPDGQYLFVSSGDRQKKEPAQDTANTLGTVVRLNLDGSPATGNPMASRASPTDEIWSYGHRNVLSLQFDASGQLWGLEHGPAGGDELNRIEPGANYGWPLVSDGNHYDGRTIPDHSTRPEFKAPAISWDPVLAPGDFIFYRGDMFGGWKGDAIITGLKTEALIQVRLDGERAAEIARYPMKRRIRDIAQGPDGAVWVIEDGDDARLLKLTI